MIHAGIFLFSNIFILRLAPNPESLGIKGFFSQEKMARTQN
jgi:hypothetical protein